MYKALLFICVGMFAAAGCDSGPNDQVSTAADANTNFCNYHTFKYYTVDEADNSDDVGPLPPTVALAEPLFKSETTRQLQLAGVTETETDPDLRVNFLWSTNMAEVITTECGSYWYGYWFGYACFDYAENVPVGTVILDLVDRLQNKVVFRGIMQGVLTGEDTEARIADVVARVFAEYPPNVTPCL